MSANHQIIEQNKQLVNTSIYAKNPIKSGFLAIILTAISWYQKTLSPDHGWGRLLFPHLGCKFYPSCSEYTKQSLEIHGIYQGLWLGVKRLARCHPFSKGGFDLVKQQ